MKTTAIREVLQVYGASLGREGRVLLNEAWEETDAASDIDDPEPDLQARVADFHRACGLPVASEPTFGTPAQRELRVRLILEEAFEFAKAAGVRITMGGGHGFGAGYKVKGSSDFEFAAVYEPNLVAMTHELADVQYVTSGTAVELGLPLPEAFSEVHAANMRKVGPDGKVVMVNGKVCKPEGWVPADVAKVLKR